MKHFRRVIVAEVLGLYVVWMLFVAALGSAASRVASVESDLHFKRVPC